MEVCSENIMTLKKTLEVRSGFFTAFFLIKFVISCLGGDQLKHLDFCCAQIPEVFALQP